MNVLKDKSTVSEESCTKHLPFAARLRQNLPAHLFAIATTAMFGLAIRPLVPGVSADTAVLWILLITGTGWLLHILFSTVFLPRLFTTYHCHLASIMWRGVLPLFLVIILAVGSVHSVLLTILCVATSSIWMIYQHIQHVRSLYISQWWTVLWFTLLMAGAIFWLFIFWENL